MSDKDFFTRQPALEPVKMSVFRAAVSCREFRVEREVDSLSS